MTMKCRKCKREYDVQSGDYIVCEACKAMYFASSEALQSFLGHVDEAVYSLNEKSHELNQKMYSDPVHITISEKKVLESEGRFISLRADMNFLKKNDYRYRNETEWANKIYEFKMEADNLLNFYLSESVN